MEFVMNIILSSVRMATPLIFLALAELYSQRAGLVHIGLEGLASIGSLVGFLVSLITGSPMLGVLAGAAVGILVNMIFAYATVTLCAEQIVYGMAINIFAPALAAFIYRVYFGAGSELVQVGLMNTLSGSLGITSDNFLVRLLLDQILYVERVGRSLRYFCSGGAVDSLSLRVPFHAAVEPLLADSRFCQCGSSFAFNLQHVTGVSGQEVLLDSGGTAAIPRASVAPFKHAWGRFWLEEG